MVKLQKKKNYDTWKGLGGFPRAPENEVPITERKLVDVIMNARP
jgi:hypothetical protein